MNSIKILLLLSLLNLSIATAQEPSEDDVNAMEKIAFTCKRMPNLTFPLPNDEDIKVHNFKSYSKRINDALSELKVNNPNIENSTYSVNGTTFNSLLTPCLKLIQTTEEKLNPKSNAIPQPIVKQQTLPTTVITTSEPIEVQSQPIQIAQKPNQKAQALLQKAFMLCDTAKHLKERGELSDKKISLLYDPYHRAIEKAEAEDSQTKNWKTEKLSECNQLITQQHLAIEEKKREEKAIAQANTLKAQQEREALSRQQDETYEKEKQADFERRLAKAKSLGYKSLEPSITIFLAKLKHNDLSMSNAKTALVLKSYKDRFKVASIVGNEVIYSYIQEGFDDFRIKQIAISKISNRFYEENAPLPVGYYSFRGIKEFTTVLGVTKQIAMFKMVEEFH